MPFNSRIQVKWGQCIDCQDGKDKPLTAERCGYHYKAYRNKINRQKQSSRMTDHEVNRTQELDLELECWFQDRMSLLALNPFCSECGSFIPEVYYRHAVAHIFPKAQFPSVRTAPWNYLFLSAQCGCHDKSHRLDTFSKMQVWPEAVMRFYTFECDIAESHKYLSSFKSYIQ